MAVEARHHLNLFPNQLITNREFIKSSNNPIPGPSNNIMYNSTQLETGLLYPNEATIPETLLPLYQSLGCENPTSVNKKLSMNNNKADSGLTYNVPAVPCNVGVAPRKRPRGDLLHLDAFPASSLSQKPKFCSGLSSFVDTDVVFRFHQQHLEIDRFISEHNQKVRMELEESRRRQSKMLVMAVQEGVMEKLIEKEEELQRMGKLNWSLQERVKSLYLENQVWRDLAHTNEATANSLRCNLEKVLAQFSSAALVDDAESSCGSSDPDRWTLAAGEHHSSQYKKGPKGGCIGNNFNVRLCKKCGERESSVLLLPCRHLCLCTLCGSTSVGTCPVCDSVMTATVHVNMS